MSPKDDDGALTALQHVAEWVRFADVKAGLLAAGAAAVIATGAGRLGEVVDMAKGNLGLACLAGVFGLAALISGIFFVWSLVSTIGPRTKTPLGHATTNARTCRITRRL